MHDTYVSIKPSKTINFTQHAAHVTANFDHVKCCIQKQNTHTLTRKTITVARESRRAGERQSAAHRNASKHALTVNVEESKVWGGGFNLLAARKT